MAPAKSVRIIRPIDKDELYALYQRERDPDRRIQILGLYHMIRLQDCQAVADLVLKSVECVRKWVNEFNEIGIESIYPKKNDLDESRFSMPKNKRI